MVWVARDGMGWDPARLCLFMRPRSGPRDRERLLVIICIEQGREGPGGGKGIS